MKNISATIERIRELLADAQIEPLAEELNSYHSADLADILQELKEDERLDCFKYSRTLIKEKKGKLFYLILSFIGLELLGLLSLGIGLLWVEPYKQQTLACFYRNATGEAFNEYV